MRHLVWSLKAAILVAALLVLSGGYTFGVRAQDEGIGVEGGGGVCFPGVLCKASSTNQCFCVGAGEGCTGCFIPNGESGCGKCTT